MGQKGGGGRLGKRAGVEKKSVGIGGQLVAAGDLGDRDPVQGKKPEGMLAGGRKHAVAIAHTDDTHRTMALLEIGNGHQDLELAGAFANHVTRRPGGRMDDSDPGVGIGAVRGCQQSDEPEESRGTAKRGEEAGGEHRRV